MWDQHGLSISGAWALYAQRGFAGRGVGINYVVKAAGYRRIYGGGGGLIALTEWLGIGAFTGRRGIGAVDSVV